MQELLAAFGTALVAEEWAYRAFMRVLGQAGDETEQYYVAAARRKAAEQALKAAIRAHVSAERMKNAQS